MNEPIVDYSGVYLELKARVDQIWQEILSQNFSEARTLCLETKILSQQLRDQLAQQHPGDGHVPK
jgi:hypothetical protein